MTTIISLFETLAATAALRERRDAITKLVADLRCEAEGIDQLLSDVDQVTEIYEGVALAIDPHDPDQSYDVSVRQVERGFRGDRWAKACRNVRSNQWMVSIHGSGLRSGGEILSDHHDALDAALDAARKWTALGER
jgi:hypothetical protein